MNLLDAFAKEFVMMNKTAMPDGENGFYTSWEPSKAVFKMPENHNTTIEAQKAEKEGTASVYTFLPKQGLEFEYGDIFKRLEDGQYFRVTLPTGEKVTPAYISKMNRGYMKAEKLSQLPT